MALFLEMKEIKWINSFNNKKSLEVKSKGKWLSFIPIEYADSVWKKIDLSTKEGKLGFHSKMSSPIISNHSGKMVCVLCVYTYDWHDSKDILRVREELRNLGFIKKIKYICKMMYYE